MVSVVHSVAAQSDFDQYCSPSSLMACFCRLNALRLRASVEYAWEVYGEAMLGSGERIWSHALGMAVIIAGLQARCRFAHGGQFFSPSRPTTTRHRPNRRALRQAGGASGQRHFAPEPLAPDHQGFCRCQCRGRRGQSGRNEGADRSAAQDVAGDGRGHPRRAVASGQPDADPAFLRGQPGRSARSSGARNAGSLLAAGQPPRGLGIEVGTGGSCPSVSCTRIPTSKSPKCSTRSVPSASSSSPMP
jgi:hypothetical protein